MGQKNKNLFSKFVSSTENHQVDPKRKVTAGILAQHWEETLQVETDTIDGTLALRSVDIFLDVLVNVGMSGYGSHHN